MSSPARGQRRGINQTSVVLSQLMQPADANFMGNIHGGVIMKLCDEAAGVCAYQFCRTPVVTAAIVRVDFHHPVHVGNLVVLKASINHAGRTSMEVGVRVEAEDLETGEIIHTNSAYLVYVSLGDDGKPAPVPEYVPQTVDDERRLKAALERRRLRLAARSPAD
jgi:uncharacterized protein (TIGR00369 family)